MSTIFIGVLLAAALTTNVPLGIWRSRLRRFSVTWFIAIHASIPVLIGMRFILGVPNWVIPPEIALAFVGQFAGARLQIFRWPSGFAQGPVSEAACWSSGSTDTDPKPIPRNW